MKNEREEVRLIDANKLLDKAHDIRVKQYPSGALYQHRCVDISDVVNAPTVKIAEIDKRKLFLSLDDAVNICKHELGSEYDEEIIEQALEQKCFIAPVQYHIGYEDAIKDVKKALDHIAKRGKAE